MRRVTIVGGSLAGFRAAQSLRLEGFDGAIRIIGGEDHLPVDRPPLSKQVLSGQWEPAKAALRGVDDVAADWLLGRRAVALDKLRLDSGIACLSRLLGHLAILQGLIQLCDPGLSCGHARLGLGDFVGEQPSAQFVGIACCHGFIERMLDLDQALALARQALFNIAQRR